MIDIGTAPEVPPGRAPSPSLPINLPPFAITAQAAWISVLRPADMLTLEFRFVNLTLNTSVPEGPALQRQKAGEDSFIVVRFPPQAIAEEAFRDPAVEQPYPPDLPIRSRATSSTPITAIEAPYRQFLSPAADTTGRAAWHAG